MGEQIDKAISEKAISQYLASFQAICPELNAEELGFIKSKVTVKNYAAKSFFLRAGSIQPDMGFAYQGLLRSYYLDQQGNEITISFIKEGEYASDYPSFIAQKPSHYFIQCLEPCTMVHLSYTAIQEAYRHHKKFERYGRLIAEAILVKKEERLQSFLFQNAEDRYLDFVASNQSLHNRVSLTQLSSFLGIKRQSLSRIRKNMRA